MSARLLGAGACAPGSENADRQRGQFARRGFPAVAAVRGRRLPLAERAFADELGATQRIDAAAGYDGSLVLMGPEGNVRAVYVLPHDFRRLTADYPAETIASRVDVGRSYCARPMRHD